MGGELSWVGSWYRKSLRGVTSEGNATRDLTTNICLPLVVGSLWKAPPSCPFWTAWDPSWRVISAAAGSHGCA